MTQTAKTRETVKLKGKTPPTVKARIDRLTGRTNARALKALEQGLFHLKQFHSWRQIEFNAPPGSRIDLKARDEAQTHAAKAHGYFNVVRAALGADLDDDEPQPKQHWDAGA
jgi:hypothetical protein